MKTEESSPGRRSFASPTEREMPGAGDELCSWKEIAAFVGRDERTAMRWAKEQGMPIRRGPGGARARVHASRSEISAWLAREINKTDQVEESAPAKDNRALKKRVLAVVAGIAIFGVVGSSVLILRPSRVDLPVRVTFAADSFRVLDADDKILWTHRFPGVLEPVVGGVENVAELSRMARVVDLRGDGEREVIVVAPIRVGARLDNTPQVEVDCFSSTGRLLWSYKPAEKFQFGENKLEDGWAVFGLMISRSTHSIFVAVSQSTWGNSFVAELDSQTGRSKLRFVNTGTIRSLAEIEVQKHPYLLVGGFNNEYEGGVLAVIDERTPFAASPQTVGSRHQCVNCPSGNPDYYYVFPRSELSSVGGLHENSVSVITRTGDSIELAKIELRTEPAVTTLFYTLPTAIGATRASLRFDSTYEIIHKKMEGEGKLNHPFSECPELLHPLQGRVWSGSEGWKALEIKSTQ